MALEFSLLGKSFQLGDDSFVYQHNAYFIVCFALAEHIYLLFFSITFICFLFKIDRFYFLYRIKKIVI